MIIVHDIFVCKPGNASKLAKKFKEVMKNSSEFVQIMTDMTGQYHRVIVAATFSSLADYEEKMKTMGQSEEEKKMMEKFSNMNEMYVSGERQIFKIW